MTRYPRNPEDGDDYRECDVCGSDETCVWVVDDWLCSECVTARLIEAEESVREDVQATCWATGISVRCNCGQQLWVCTDGRNCWTRCEPCRHVRRWEAGKPLSEAAELAGRVDNRPPWERYHNEGGCQRSDWYPEKIDGLVWWHSSFHPSIQWTTPEEAAELAGKE